MVQCRKSVIQVRKSARRFSITPNGLAASHCLP